MVHEEAPAARHRAPLRRSLVVAVVSALAATFSLSAAAGRSAAQAGLEHRAGQAVGAFELSASRSYPDVPGEPIPFGTARYHGALTQKELRSAAVGIAASAGGSGYWLATANGGVFTFGHAKFHGAAPAQNGRHIAAIVATGDRGGYWLASSDGAVFRFGDAKFHGSAVGDHLSSPIVAMASTPGGRGYWLASADGAVFHYGDAKAYSPTVGDHPSSPIVAMAATPDGGGYWLASADGAVFHYGDAKAYGSAVSEHLRDQVVAMVATPVGRGYWLFASGGGVFTYGNARFHGSASAAALTNPIVAAASTPDGQGYWLLPSTPAPLALPAPGSGFVAGHVTAIGDSVMIDAQPDLEADIPGIDVEAMVSRQWDDGIALAQQLKSEDRLGAIVVIDLGTNGPVTPQQFTQMMDVLSGASRVVFVTVHLPSYYSWWQSVNQTLEQGVPKYSEDRLADFNKLADENPQWFGPDGVHMPIGGTGAQAMAKLIKSQI